MVFLVSCASNLTGEVISQVFIALNQGMIVVLIVEGSKVRDRPTGDLSLYYWEHLKYVFTDQIDEFIDQDNDADAAEAIQDEHEHKDLDR